MVSLHKNSITTGILFFLFLFKNAGASMVPLRATCYSDGASCPGGCDAHFVINPTHNSTTSELKNIYLPGTRETPKPCERGKLCTVCFSEDPKNCWDSMYRGAGPRPGIVDVTPNFLHAYCYRPGSFDVLPDLPTEIDAICRRVARNSVRLEEKTNCIREPDHPKCRQMMDLARTAKEKDTVLYNECKKLGESAFNARHPQSERRSLSCNYTLTAVDHGGRKWLDLLPAACSADAFVSPNGLDCCSADTVQSACSGDCGVFFK